MKGHHRRSRGFIVRLATADEASSIASILREAFAPYEPQYTADAFVATVPASDVIRARWHEGPVWVVVHGEAIVGTVAAVLKDGGAYVRSMAVAPTASGHGLGARLLEHVERFARDHGMRRLFLSTTPFLADAIRLYERHGFRRSADGPQTLCGTPLLTMEKPLVRGEAEGVAEKPANPTEARRCPRSGSPGNPIEPQTVKALLTERALARLAPGEYWFCPDAGCEVVYFGPDDVRFTTADVRVGVWQKQPPGDRQVCYCFGESEASMRAEIAADGRSSAVERIREHIAASRSACEIRNPRGTCCLGDVIAAVDRVTSGLS